ncbi:hypothetical protein CA830_01855 [Burkholderia multivorans]|nr:hypothetical protein CA831_29280 [Burkholderia multivorans]OXH94395.1 hypothetical protein CA830_01855 [Burkholderia multivorans]
MEREHYKWYESSEGPYFISFVMTGTNKQKLIAEYKRIKQHDFLQAGLSLTTRRSVETPLDLSTGKPLENQAGEYFLSSTFRQEETVRVTVLSEYHQLQVGFIDTAEASIFKLQYL